VVKIVLVYVDLCHTSKDLNFVVTSVGTQCVLCNNDMPLYWLGDVLVRMLDSRLKRSQV